MAIPATKDSVASQWIIGALSVLVVASVVFAIYVVPSGSPSSPAAPSPLASVNAVLNASAAVFLVIGYAFIRRRQVRAHRRCMLTAFGLSCLFLVTYLLHHAQVGSVPFQGQGAIRAVYFAFLIPHILLATVVVPLALLTIYRGWTNRIALHRRVARWTLPIWLYVSVSGVVVYWMLYHSGVA